MTFVEKFCWGCLGVVMLVSFYELGRKHGDITMTINIDESSLNGLTKEKENDVKPETEVEGPQEQ